MTEVLSKEQKAMGQESIVVEGLTKRYGEVEALRGLDFRVRPGEIVGFLGPNGAGKTTTMKILTGFMAATSGQATVAGLDVRKESEGVRRKIGYLPENVPLYEDMLVYDYLCFVADVREVPGTRQKARIKAVAAMTGIGHMLGRAIGELSKGYRQRVGLAQAIIHEPEVLILDEPTTGLDPGQIVEIRDVIKTIGKEKTVIFSTHILQEVAAVCDRIIVINRGEIVADGTLNELSEQVARPGLLVRFEEEAEALEAFLAGLSGAASVESLGVGEYRVVGDEAEIRGALIAAEAKESRGLLSFVGARASLEEVFRVFTTAQSSEEQVEEEQVEEEQVEEEQVEEEEPEVVDA